MKLNLFIIIVIALSIQGCKNDSSKEEGIGEIELISPQQVYDAVYGDDTIQLLDVRTKEEFTDSHVKGAQNICVTDTDFKEKVKRLDKDKPVYVYCKKGGHSAMAAAQLKEMGFTKVYDMKGGITSWKENNLQVEN